MTATPFIVYALPRSRTAWLSRFLTYGGWTCRHERAIEIREIADIPAFFAAPMTGSVETAAAQAWQIIHQQVPNIRAAVIRRAVEDVVQAMMRVDLGGEFRYDEARLRKNMAYGDRMLGQVARLPGVLELEMADLDHEDGARAIFEHCLGLPFDRDWWLSLKDQDVQVDVRAHIRYYHANFAAINRTKSLLWAELRRLRKAGLTVNRGSPCRH